MKKVLVCSIVNIFFAKRINKNKKRKDYGIFIKSVDPNSGKTLIIEEGPHNVWVYILNDDKNEIEFKGFLCSVVSPVKLNTLDKKPSIPDGPLPIQISNKYTWVKNLRKENITVEWKFNFVIIRIKGKVYLVMDRDLKISHSKGLSVDCDNGNSL